MKTRIKILLFLLILFTSINLAPQKSFAQGVSVSFQVFYDELSPYGTWVDTPDYGYVWVPDVAPGFSPYATNGYWIFTDQGWTWISNYSWGWAPFHYGRWYTDAVYGPMWVPDNEWGPGWVTWRRSGGYYGWAPIGPGISINLAYSNGYNVPSNQWRFVRDRDFGRRDIHNYYINSSKNVTIINNSTVINNTRVDDRRNVRFNAGPDRAEVEKHVGKKFASVVVKDNSKPGQNVSKNQLQIYRPEVQKSISNQQKPAPAKVGNLKEVKPAAQRTTEPQKKNNITPVNQQSPPSVRHPLPPVKAPPQQQAQPAKQQPTQQQHQSQPPNKQQPQAQPQKQQPTAQPVKQQPPQQQHQAQPPKAQPQAQPQQQHQAQPPKAQPQAQPQQQRQAQPTKAQPQAQPQKQQPPQQQHQAQPPKTQPQAQPPKQQLPQQQHQTQPPKAQPQAQPQKQQPSQPQQPNPPKNPIG